LLNTGAGEQPRVGATHGPCAYSTVRLLVVFIFSHTMAEVLPFVVSGIPWTQPQAMKYGGFVIIALALWLLLSWRSSRDER
jgi:hypothetical protein